MIARAVVGPGRPSGKEQCIGAAELDDAADTGAGLGGAADSVGALAGDLRANGDLLAEVVRRSDCRLPEVAVAAAGVHHVAATAEDAGATRKILLEPEGQKEARLFARG